MIPLQLIVGISCVVVAAAAIYFNLPARAAPHQTRSARRPNGSSNDDADNCSDRKRSVRKSKPGDKCILCLQPMTAATMHTMSCGHALCQTPCFRDYHAWRRHCPYCEKIVIRIDSPGDDCSICCEPLTEETMEYLKCEHALHKTCLREYRRNNYKICPVCKRKL